MKFLRLAGVLLILAVCQPAFAQMKESIEVRISTDQKINNDNEQYIANACAEAELLLLQGCFGFQPKKTRPASTGHVQVSSERNFSPSKLDCMTKPCLFAGLKSSTRCSVKPNWNLCSSQNRFLSHQKIG